VGITHPYVLASNHPPTVRPGIVILGKRLGNLCRYFQFLLSLLAPTPLLLLLVMLILLPNLADFPAVFCQMLQEPRHTPSSMGPGRGFLSVFAEDQVNEGQLIDRTGCMQG